MCHILNCRNEYFNKNRSWEVNLKETSNVCGQEEKTLPLIASLLHKMSQKIVYKERKVGETERHVAT